MANLCLGPRRAGHQRTSRRASRYSNNPQVAHRLESLVTTGKLTTGQRELTRRLQVARVLSLGLVSCLLRAGRVGDGFEVVNRSAFANGSNLRRVVKASLKGPRWLTLDSPRGRVVLLAFKPINALGVS